MIAAAEQETEPLKRVNAHLEAANWILARQAEPMISRLLLELDGPFDQASLRQALGPIRLRVAVGQARAQLAAAKQLLGDRPATAIPQAAEDPPRFGG